MKHRLFVGIVVVLLLSHCVLASKVQLQAASANVAKLAFTRELQTGDDIQLSGPTSISVVDLKLSPRWQLSGSGSLHLFVRHSPGFDGDKSFLTVTLNYALLRSIRLDETNEEMGELTVPVPSSSIRQTNELVLGVEQVDAKGAPLTVIASRSFFEFPYIEIPLQWDLGHLRTGFSSRSLKASERPAVLLPVNASSATLEATALVVGNLMGRSVDSPRALRFVRRFDDWNGPLFVIGTPSEQPELVSLQGAAPLVFHRGRKEITVSGPGDHSTNKTDGYIGIALNARYRIAPVIFVTGNSPAAVLKAARALASPNWAAAGRFARITGDTHWPTVRMREWDGFIPPSNSFQLSDLAHSDIQVGYPEGATIPLRVPPDARFLDYGHEVTLKLALNSEFYVAGSYIVVKLNGSELERYPTDKLGGLAGSVRISIPAKVLGSDNALKVTWQGPAPSMQLNTVGWISRDTEFYLPRNYEADLPDLALLRKHLYPFSINADFSDVLFVVADRAKFDCVSALLAAISGVARLAPSEHIAPRIAHSRELNDYDLSNFHLVFLSADESGGLPLQVAIASPSTANTARMHQRVWEITSPWSARKCVLVISARTAAELLSVTQSVFSLDKLNQLTGDAAFFDARSTLCLHLRHRRNLADVSYNLMLQSWLREHWLLLPIVVTGFSGALFLMVRIALQQNRYVR